MTYNFVTTPNRLKDHAVKWQEVEQDPELLPMWVADMDFEAFPELKGALKKFSERSVFGYTYVAPSFYDTIIAWEKAEHNYQIKTEDIIPISGVVPPISVAVQAFTNINDAVLINTPLYPPFARTIALNQRKIVTNSLVKVNGHFEIDFDQLEKDIIDNDVKLYAFCSPHNPGGRVWTHAELVRVAELCKKHQVILICDEIHQDLTLFGHQHHSFNTVGDYKAFAIVLTSVTKTFNIAGIGTAYALIEDPELKQKFTTHQLANNQHEVGTIGLLATEAAIKYGKPWLVALKQVLEENITFVMAYFSSHAPRVSVMKPEGGYLIWLDFSDYKLRDWDLYDLFRKEAKVILNDGITFGSEGAGHVRLNVATPLINVKETVERIVAVLPE